MATLNSILPDSGIFTAIDAINPFPWRDVITPAQMDATYKALYTSKPISKLVESLLGANSVLTEDNIKVLANYLYVLYYEKWTLVYKLYQSQNNAFNAGYSETVKTTMEKDFTTTDKGTIASDKTDTNKINAFDLNTFADKEQSTNTGTDTRDLTGTDAGTQTTESEKSGYSISYMNYYKKSIQALQDYLIYGIIFVDANSVLARHVYNLYE